MRIISGNFRGKILASPTSDNIRPTLDKVKQALFTRLQFRIPESFLLDLFAGSGALGIEAISRNARHVVFVDNNEKSISLVKKNLTSIGFQQKGSNYVSTKQTTTASVFKLSFLDALTKLAEDKIKFDIIILDPPYEKVEYYIFALQKIFDCQLLAPDGIIVCERLKNSTISCDTFLLDATKIYGTVALDYFVNK